MTRLKLEPGMSAGNSVLSIPSTTGANNNNNNPSSTMVGSGNVNNNTQQLSLTSMDCYEDMFKEITKKLYGDDGLALISDPNDPTGAGSIVYDAEGSFRADGSLTLVTANGLPGTLVVQRRPMQDDKEEQLALAPSPTSVLEERWFESDDGLDWTTSKIARYNPAQKVFRCVDCDFVGFLSRVAEHWLGNHASLRVFQCPRCPYTSAWARCVRMHLTRQHGETLTDNSLWKENPVLEEVTKFLNSLKTRVEQKAETLVSGEKRYICQYCSYATDRRDLFNRHENIHRDEKPFQCFVCDKQFNRADHVKKHFTRMHRDHAYDINRIRKHFPKSSANLGGGVSLYQAAKAPKHENTSVQQQPQQQQQQQQQLAAQQQQQQEQQALQQQIQQQQQTAQQLQQQLQQQQQQIMAQIQEQTGGLGPDGVSIQLQTASSDGNVRSQTVTLQQIPHIAYFNPPSTPGQTGPLQGIQGVGGTKKEAKAKGQKKKKQYDKMYSCSYCPWQGVDNWCLKRHLNTHIKPFLCALCDYKAARSERLATHVLKVHNKRVCHKCSFLADDPESLAQHVQDSHQNPLVKTGFNCNLCQEYFELRADLEAHAILEHQKVIVQCDLCDFRTTDELSMESHLREKHNLQPGMGAVAAAAAAATAAGQQQAAMQQQMQMSVPQSVMMQMPEPIPVVVEQPPPPPELVISDIPDQTVVKHEITSYHIDEAITTVLTPEVTETDKEPDTGCDICGCEFYDEVSVRRHKKCHEVRKVEASPLRNSKTISRTYTCSTCSYNCATSRIMMQHQKVHSGFEVECKVEGCLFSSPFENSLKEHIHSEHNDGPIRCLHCGYTVPSLIDFTFHWRNHHSAICSLCIGIYKSKYGMKEPEIHDLLLLTPLEMLNYSKASEEESQGMEAPPMQAFNEGEPLAKRPRDELNSVFTSVTSYFNNPSISFLPRFIDITVTSVVKKKKRRKTKWNCRNTRGKFIRGTVRRLLSTRRDSHKPIYLTRQTLQPKCHSHGCRYKFKRYVSTSKLALHKLWHHTRRPLIECDSCDQRFSFLYKALLHRKSCRFSSMGQGRVQFSLEHTPQHSFRLNNNDHTRILFKHE